MKQYKVTPGFLVEMPRMEEPQSYDIYEWQEYEQHLKSLQRIPIAPNVSFDGEIINEDQFSLTCPKTGECLCLKMSKCSKGERYAYPKSSKSEKMEEVNEEEDLYDAVARYREKHPEPPQPTQEEMFNDVARYALGEDFKFYDNVIEILKSKYTISKK